MAAENILVTGHTGVLGNELMKLAPNMIGISRSNGYDLANLKPTAMEELWELHGPITHVVHCANLRSINNLELQTADQAADAYKVAVYSACEIYKQLTPLWKNVKLDKSLTLISSVSGTYYCGANQVIYGPLKAAQISLATYLDSLSDVRCNVVIPDGFPRYIPTQRVVDAISRCMNDIRLRRANIVIDRHLS